MWYKLNSCFTSYCNQSTDVKIQHINHLRQLRFSGWQIALHFGTPHNFRLYLSGDLNTRFDFFIRLEKKEKGIDAIFRNPRFWSDEKPQLSMLKLYCSINCDENAYESINAAGVSLSKVMGKPDRACTWEKRSGRESLLNRPFSKQHSTRYLFKFPAGFVVFVTGMMRWCL